MFDEESTRHAVSACASPLEKTGIAPVDPDGRRTDARTHRPLAPRVNVWSLCALDA
jgi:hypothetical protein